jgi:hypothetical protein
MKPGPDFLRPVRQASPGFRFPESSDSRGRLIYRIDSTYRFVSRRVLRPSDLLRAPAGRHRLLAGDSDEWTPLPLSGEWHSLWRVGLVTRLCV